MSEEHDPFLRAIEAAPDDPLPKLLFADHLDERGDPRAAGLRWLVDQGKKPAHDTQYGSWDWWSCPPAEPDFYDGAVSVAFAVLPANLFRRLKGDPGDVWKGYPTFTEALLDVLHAWQRCGEDGIDPTAVSTSE
jgi:uncharacterized protein (TIGR02996 family)